MAAKIGVEKIGLFRAEKGVKFCSEVHCKQGEQQHYKGLLCLFHHISTEDNIPMKPKK